MKRLRETFLMTVAILLLGQSSFANSCEVKCKDALDKADKLILNLKEEISTLKTLKDIQDDQIRNLSLQNAEKGDALASPFRNPYIMVPLGILAGGLTVLLLHK